MGDFTGFSFGDWHSTDPVTGVVTVYRVSGSDRYTEELFPEIKDLTAEVPGLNGEYYFGSSYGSRTFTIDFAFDSLTEEQFRTLRKTFGTKDIKRLVFDERPYKYYMAKIESPIELSFVCFDEPKKRIIGNGVGEPRYGVRRDPETRELERIYPYETLSEKERIYKGEGSISLVCYFPFAKSIYKQIPYIYQKTEDNIIIAGKKYFIKENMQYYKVINPTVENLDIYYERVNIPEVKDWVSSSGILSVNDYEEFDEYDITTGQIKIYNPGDLPTGFRLYCPFIQNQISALKIIYSSGLGETAELNIDQIVPQKNKTNYNDIGILINTDNELIQGVQTFGIDSTSNNATYTTSGNLYNSYIDSGYFFKLNPTISSFDGATITIVDNNNRPISAGIEIFYDYLYF